MQAGKTYYFFVHAYFHVIARLDEVTGKQSGNVSSVVGVRPSNATWESLFQNGLANVRTDKFPPGNISWFAAFEWNHPIPQ